MIQLQSKPNLPEQIDSLDSSLLMKSSANIDLSFENESNVDDDYKSNMRRIMTQMVLGDSEENKEGERPSNNIPTPAGYKSRIF
jgi:hypothetical protein